MDNTSDPHTIFTIPVASGIFYPSDSHQQTSFNLNKNDKNEYFIFMNTNIIPSGYGLLKNQIVERVGFPITNEEYTSLITPPIKTRIGLSNSIYTYRDIRKYGSFKIKNVKGGMKRKTNKRKRKNARKSRKHK